MIAYNLPLIISDSPCKVCVTLSVHWQGMWQLFDV